MAEDQSNQMVEDQGNQEEKIDFTPQGAARDNISLSQARVMALRTARANPSRRRWILPKRMLFDVLDDSEEEDSYTIVVSFRPEGDFDGTPGQERFKFSKAGRFQDREVLSHPKSSRRFSIKRKTAVVGVIAVFGLIVLVVLVLVLMKTYQSYGDLATQSKLIHEYLPQDSTRYIKLS